MRVFVSVWLHVGKRCANIAGRLMVFVLVAVGVVMVVERSGAYGMGQKHEK